MDSRFRGLHTLKKQAEIFKITNFFLFIFISPFALTNFKNTHLLNYEVKLISLLFPQGVIQHNVSLNLILNAHSIIDKIKCNLNYRVLIIWAPIPI